MGSFGEFPLLERARRAANPCDHAYTLDVNQGSAVTSGIHRLLTENVVDVVTISLLSDIFLGVPIGPEYV